MKNNVVYLSEFRKKKEEYAHKKRMFIEEFTQLLESSNWAGDDDYDFSEWFDFDSETYTLTLDEGDDSSTIDFDD
ncbi:hypothetical protein [Planktomarina sp.]|uniref:hypothetical protein n=1 Tax=Planktomarina sp. TaxID=2024851 RepID=UPI0032612293